tara:strand:- start:21 stop:626 length:606 start_codon:yes stop_codon:yes gene_type:complete
MKDQIKLFIHIPKNGGSSVKADERTNKFVIFNTGVGWHSRWKDTPKKISDAYKAFGIIRNPWSRTVSRYMFGVESIYRGDHGAIPKNFDEFLETRYVWKNEWADPIRSWNTQYDYVCDDEDNVCCDILRLEHIDYDLPKYFNIDIKQGVVKENATGYTQDYRNVYNDNTIQIVADWYQQDIDYWGFDFDTGATKNTYFKFI